MRDLLMLVIGGFLRHIYPAVARVTCAWLDERAARLRAKAAAENPHRAAAHWVCDSRPVPPEKK